MRKVSMKNNHRPTQLVMPYIVLTLVILAVVKFGFFSKYGIFYSGNSVGSTREVGSSSWQYQQWAGQGKSNARGESKSR